jgi:RIO kinase 1
MKRNRNNPDWWQELDDNPNIEAPDLPSHSRSNGKKPYKLKRLAGELGPELDQQSEREASFHFSYNASRHERQWILDSLGYFYESHWFDDVLRLLQGGKEASVYQCAAHPSSSVDYLAAKVYRPRMFRQLKKDHLYREGRANLDADGHVILDDGMQHAMARKTGYGLKLLHTSWIEHEYQTLVKLHAAGADVPEPYARGDNAILMAYIGGEDLPAPTLNTVELSAAEARPLFQRVLHNIELMLAHQRVHGDLSAYNILYLEGEIVLIDFPQAINPFENRNAYPIFERDVTRVCEYFARQGVRSQPVKLAADLWTAHRYRRAPEIHPALLDVNDERDRQIWQQQNERRD